MTLRGHRTSLALEPAFWAALDEACAEDRSSLAGLIAAVDEERSADVPLASALRVYLLARATAR